MLGGNPLINQTGGAEAYVTQQAEGSMEHVNKAAKVPVDLAGILIASGIGLFLLKLADFRFVVSGSAGRG